MSKKARKRGSSGHSKFSIQNPFTASRVAQARVRASASISAFGALTTFDFQRTIRFLHHLGASCKCSGIDHALTECRLCESTYIAISPCRQHGQDY